MILSAEVARDSRLDRVAPRRIVQIIAAVVLAIASLGYAGLAFFASSVVVQFDVGLWFDPLWKLQLAAIVWLCLVVFGISILLFEGRKYTVLYLRRFRSELSGFIGTQIEHGLGRRFRVVTLDDAQFTPLEVPWAERWSSRVVPAILSAAAIGLFLWTMQNVGRDELQQVEYGAIGTIATATMVAFWTLNIWLLLVLVLAHRYRIRRRARIGASDPRGLRQCCHQVSALRRWGYRLGLMAPQATVITVSNDLWQAAVIDLSEIVDVILVDVSEPSGALSWEVSHVTTNPRPHVFIAEGDRLKTWVSAAEGGQPESENTGGTLLQRLREESVLLYSVEARTPRSGFTRSFGRALRYAAAGSTPRRSRTPWRERIPTIAAAAGYYSTVTAFALTTGFWLQGRLQFWILRWAAGS